MHDPLRKTLRIVNARGLHARAAALLARVAGGFDAQVTLHKDGFSAPATSMTEMLMLGAGCDSAIDITATGPEAAKAVEAVCDLIARGFNES